MVSPVHVVTRVVVSTRHRAFCLGVACSVYFGGSLGTGIIIKGKVLLLKARTSTLKLVNRA